jgi:hypothetical protein
MGNRERPVEDGLQCVGLALAWKTVPVRVFFDLVYELVNRVLVLVWVKLVLVVLVCVVLAFVVLVFAFLVLILVFYVSVFFEILISRNTSTALSLLESVVEDDPAFLRKSRCRGCK